MTRYTDSLTRQYNELLPAAHLDEHGEVAGLTDGEFRYETIRMVAAQHRMTPIHETESVIYYLTRTGLVVAGWFDSPVGANGFDTADIGLSGQSIVRLRIDGFTRSEYYVTGHPHTGAFYTLDEWTGRDGPSYLIGHDYRLYNDYGDTIANTGDWRAIRIARVR